MVEEENKNSPSEKFHQKKPAKSKGRGFRMTPSKLIWPAVVIIAAKTAWYSATLDKKLEHRFEEEKQAKENQEDVNKFNNDYEKVKEEYRNATKNEQDIPKKNNLDSLKVNENDQPLDLDAKPLSQFMTNKNEVIDIEPKLLARDNENGLDAVGSGNTAYIIPRAPSA